MLSKLVGNYIISELQHANTLQRYYYDHLQLIFSTYKRCVKCGIFPTEGEICTICDSSGTINISCIEVNTSIIRTFALNYKCSILLMHEIDKYCTIYIEKINNKIALYKTLIKLFQIRNSCIGCDLHTNNIGDKILCDGCMNNFYIRVNIWSNIIGYCECEKPSIIDNYIYKCNTCKKIYKTMFCIWCNTYNYASYIGKRIIGICEDCILTYDVTCISCGMHCKHFITQAYGDTITVKCLVCV